MKRTPLVFVVLGLIVALTADCARAQTSVAKKPVPACKRVIIIGIDGLRGNAVNETEAPNLKAFMKKAAYSTTAQSTTPSNSGPAWGAIFHGVGPDIHKISKDNPAADGVAWPSFVKVINQQRPKLKVGVYSSWEPILTETLEKSCVYDKFCATDGEIGPAAVNYIRTKRPDVFFVHFSIVDNTGHAYGYKSPNYYAAIKWVDTWVGKLLDAAKGMGDFDKTTVLFVADHGGMDYFNDKGEFQRHGHGSDDPESVNTFWAASGPGIVPGEIKARVDIAATAPVVIRALGLKPPAGWKATVPDGLFKNK